MRLLLDYPKVRIDYRSGFAPVQSVRTTAEPDSPFRDSQPVCRAFHCRHFTLVPDHLYDPGFRQEYLLQLGMAADTRAGTWSVPEWGCQLVGSLEEAGNTVTDQAMPLWRVFLRHAHLLREDTGQEQLWGHYSEGSLYLCGIGMQGLQFFNQFAVREPSDVLYFLLQALDQWRKAPATFPVRLSGSFLMDSPLYQLLEQYQGNLDTVQDPGPRLPGLEGTPPHQYPDLRSFALCVSSAES
jgi:hypothetical protein